MSETFAVWSVLMKSCVLPCCRGRWSGLDVAVKVWPVLTAAVCAHSTLHSKALGVDRVLSNSAAPSFLLMHGSTVQYSTVQVLGAEVQQ